MSYNFHKNCRIYNEKNIKNSTKISFRRFLFLGRILWRQISQMSNKLRLFGYSFYLSRLKTKTSSHANSLSLSLSHFSGLKFSIFVNHLLWIKCLKWIQVNGLDVISARSIKFILNLTKFFSDKIKFIRETWKRR